MIVEESAIVARDLRIRRGGRWLLRPASFGVAEGTTGLAGPPGVGKTSLLATFATLHRPHSGFLEVLGRDTANHQNLPAIRARLGYLPVSVTGAAGLEVRDFVGYAAFYKRASRSAVRAALARMGIDDIATTQLRLLPPDVRLRAGLAATCVHDPDVVLLDEPLSGLDEAARDELMPLIRGLAPTVLVTAPAAGPLTGWCDRVFSLVRGKLTELPTRANRDGRAPLAAHRPPPATGPRTRPVTGPEPRPPHRPAGPAERVLAGSGVRG
jgi:ABC-type multidrug transport system ATPase subunit